MNFPQTNLNADGRISVREKISYGFGDVACNVVFALTMSLSTYFYTDVVGMSAALVGTILLLSRIFDGISDVIVGILVDRTKSRFGKARAWVLFADRNGHAADLLLRLQGARPYPCNAAEHKNPAQDRLQVHDRQQILVADHRYVLLLGDVCHPERHHAHLLLQV